MATTLDLGAAALAPTATAATVGIMLLPASAPASTASSRALLVATAAAAPAASTSSTRGHRGHGHRRSGSTKPKPPADESNIKVSWWSKAMASAHPPQGLPSGMDPSMMDEYASSPSCCKNSSRYPALARLGSSVPKMVGVDCGAIQPGGACFEPNMVSAHAAYAMNQLY
ncbi:hypothetical protein ZWY2020_053979 [Hordeum vulgare]|nr:hypothetical protein ZWY2020_053979 [Hordeum vulgare]